MSKITESITDLLSRTLDSSECWSWPHAHDNGGRPVMRVDGKVRRVYRLIYEHHYGPIPDGLVLDHLCVNPSCVNPTHLEAVTQTENNHRTGERSTHCRKGHPRAENSYLSPSGERKCRACQQLRAEARKAARPERPPKTHCSKGLHPWVDENIYVTPTGAKCRACQAIYHAEWYRKWKESR